MLSGVCIIDYTQHCRCHGVVYVAGFRWNTLATRYLFYPELNGPRARVRSSVGGEMGIIGQNFIEAVALYVRQDEAMSAEVHVPPAWRGAPPRTCWRGRGGHVRHPHGSKRFPAREGGHVRVPPE